MREGSDLHRVESRDVFLRERVRGEPELPLGRAVACADGDLAGRRNGEGREEGDVANEGVELGGARFVGYFLDAYLSAVEMRVSLSCRSRTPRTLSIEPTSNPPEPDSRVVQQFPVPASMAL